LKKNSGYVYAVMEEDLVRQIRSGALGAGDCILSENELSRKYAISRVSVRRGIARLAQKGLLRRVPGKGTFVAGPEGEKTSTARKTLSFIVPDIEDVFISELHRGVEETCGKMGYEVIVQSCDCRPEKENQYLMRLKDQPVAGAIIFPNWGRFNTDAIFSLKQKNVPFVLIDRYFRDIDTDYVVVDNLKGAYDAVSHLVKLGHKRIAHLGGVPCTANEDRHEGYKLGLAKAKIFYDPDLVRQIAPDQIAGSSRFEPDDVGGYVETKKFLAPGKRPSAIFAANDGLAIGAFKAIREAGLKVPKDVALVGFDDQKMSALLEVPLTTVRQPKREIGKKAAEILIEKIQSGQKGAARAFKHVVLKTELVIRKSCGAGNFH